MQNSAKNGLGDRCALLWCNSAMYATQRLGGTVYIIKVQLCEIIKSKPSKSLVIQKKFDRNPISQCQRCTT